jgi:integrase
MGKQAGSVPRLGTREGRYYVFWFDAPSRQTKKRSLGTVDAGEAKKAFARWLLEDSEALQSQRPEELTVERALNDYLREHVKTKAADETRQRNAIDHLIAHFGSKPISEIDIIATRGYVRARLEGAIGGGKRRKNKVGAISTIRRELNVLVAAANHERKWKRLTTMPVIELPAEERIDHDEVVSYFERDVLDRIINAATGELRQFIKIAYYTAARRRSIENLTGAQVNITRRSIALATPGKARTKKRQPVVPIFDEIVPEVASLVAARPQGRLFSTVSFYRPFMMLCRSLDLPEPHHPHMLRHSRATHLLQDGKDLWDVAKLLGDTVKTVEATYGHHSPDGLMKKLS